MRNEGAEAALRRMLLDHNRRYPHCGVEDLYKLLHQAAMGSEHAAPEESIARSWLEQELSQLGPGPAEPIVDPIRPDGEVVRVHLRPSWPVRSTRSNCWKPSCKRRGITRAPSPPWKPRAGMRSVRLLKGSFPSLARPFAPFCKR